MMMLCREGNVNVGPPDPAQTVQSDDLRSGVISAPVVSNVIKTNQTDHNRIIVV